MTANPSPRDEPEGLVRSVRTPPRTWLRDVEAAAGSCAAGGGAAAALVMVGYVSQFSWWLPAEGWWQLSTEALIFALATGAGCGAGIAALVFTSRPPRLWHVVGGIGAVPPAAVAGAFGADYFGSMPLPYLGLAAIFAAIAVGVAVAGVGLARAAAPQIAWRRALFHALWPSFGLALVLGLAASLAPAEIDAELDVMRAYAATFGLPWLGAIGGALVGALGGLALAATMIAAGRPPRRG